uniref:MBD domain-containing protein n=1 Tax=Strigamia maritima TaxID=126957 RepID=T1IKB2_STRMM
IKSRKSPVPGKSGWIREQVQRQSGATAGQWDVYFYPPGQQVKLRSRPEVRSYCENELNEPYVAADYDWKPSQKPVDTVVQEPSTEQAVVEPQGDSPLDISNGSETHSFNPNESNDDSDDDSSSPASVEAPIIPPAASLITQAPSGIKSRKSPVPGKSGWIREQVQRQSGATAGQWDVYFYPPGQQVKLRSRPEVRSYCENELNEPYVAADYDWKPSQKPVDTVVQEPSTEQAVVEPQGLPLPLLGCGIKVGCWGVDNNKGGIGKGCCCCLASCQSLTKIGILDRRGTGGVPTGVTMGGPLGMIIEKCHIARVIDQRAVVCIQSFRWVDWCPA